MAGIYIHIPFCKKACHYCNFHFSTSLQYKERMIDAIATEISSRSGDGAQIDTVYFGGGTPSLLLAEEIEKLLDTIAKHYKMGPDPEITLEANPDDIDTTKARDWKSIGINRFSIGIQSFDDQLLQSMNRAHDAQQSLDCIEVIRKVGFDNFSIDLIYGAPEQDQKGWEKDLGLAIELQVPHLSCYALTVEEGTALFALINKGERKATRDEEQALRFKTLLQVSRDAGYHQYEISNFALAGKESRHNRSYWKGTPYLGFGPSAHSFDGLNRSWNKANNMAYILSIEKGEPAHEREVLTAKDRYNEYVMTALRSSAGINKVEVNERWGEGQLNIMATEIRPFVEHGKVQETETAWILTDEGKFFADGIAAALFRLN